MMFLSKLNGSEELKQEELEYLTCLLYRYSRMVKGTWLQELPLQKITFKWAPKLTQTKILGAFDLFHPRTIYLQPFNNLTGLKDADLFWILLMFSTSVHELRHMWQWRKFGLLYLLGTIPGVRHFTIQKDADLCMQDADQFILMQQKEHKV